MTSATDKDGIVRAVRAERRATLALVRSLEPSRFDAPTQLRGWRVRDVVAHLISVDRASVTGANFPVLFASVERLERWNDRQVPKWEGSSVQELLVALDLWGRRLVRLIRALPASAYRLPIPTYWGRAPAGLLAWCRAYDEWVHRQDIRRGLGMPDEEVDQASAAEFLLEALRHDFLRWPPGPVGEVDVTLEGVPVLPWRFDLTHRTGGPRTGQRGPRGEGSPDAAIAAPGSAFIMAAAGRESFEDLHAAGTLRVAGDADLAMSFLSRIRIV